jgi:uncharacterized iron-regulated protein
LVERAAAADIVVVGEQHTDPVCHQFQTALVSALTARNPVAVCMEMFERDEQALVDGYLTGALSAKTLVSVTDSRDWGAKGKWNDFYQPIVDAAKAGGAPVVAANAPRRFPTLARSESFEALAAYGGAYPGQFVVPAPIDQADYKGRFMETMKHHHGPTPAGKEGEAPPAMPADVLESFFRAQQVWDATMADSVVSAWRAHGKALLLVGQFHTDHQGGLLLRMQAAAPDARYLVISVQNTVATALRPEDADRADIVAFHRP